MMSTPSFRVQFFRGEKHLMDQYTGPQGELTLDATHWRIRIHDGVTPGGNEHPNRARVIELMGRTVSTTEPQPSDGVDGNIWYTYEA